jgi:hypothetical protein
MLVVLAVAAGLAHAEALASTETIGQTHPPDAVCAGPFVALQTSVAQGRPYVVPGGPWQLTSWTFSAGAATGRVAAVVAEPRGGHTYKIVAVSSLVTPVANTVGTFPWSAAVKGGDVLGIYVAGGPPIDCATFTSSESDAYDLAFVGGTPTPGETVSGSPGTNILLDVSASLLPPGTSEAAVDHEFVCYSQFEQDGGEVFDPATADALVAAGRWFPYALPGNVPGAENVGDYHLVCNPPAGYTATGQSVGDGGDVFDGAVPGAYVIETQPG